jgi:signal transduction histidine kinase
MARWRVLSAGGLLHHGVTAAVLLIAFTEAAVRHHGPTRLAAMAWAAAFAGPLIARRRYPVPVFVVVLAVVLAASPLANLEQDVVLLTLLVAAASAGREAPAPLTWVVPATVAVALAATVPLLGTDITDAIIVIALVAGAWFAGRSARLRAQLREAVAERAVLLERESRRRERDAVELERARIARELHDVVGHALSLITIRLQVVRRQLAPVQPVAAAEVQEVEHDARQALSEMRRLLDVLRRTDDHADRGPQPGLADLPELVTRTRAAGLDVHLEMDDAAGHLPPGLDLAAYRIIQEALTNTLRHAGATHATVRLTHDVTALRIDVHEDGTETPGTSDGHGLVGMRERVSLYGGTVAAAPLPRGGFHVSACIPVPAEGP